MQTSLAPRSRASVARRMISSIGQEVTFFGEMAAAEGAKAALLDADIGKIDVAIDDVADYVADGLGAQVIGGRDHGEQIGTIRLE